VSLTIQEKSVIEAEELARKCAAAAAAKKAERIVALDLRGISSYTDFFVVCSASSEPQLKAISNSIQDALREDYNCKPKAIDGFPASQWIVIDFGDVIVHLFHTELRERYALEDLWNDAPELEIDGES
jgi:ribosome-associated protein